MSDRAPVENLLREAAPQVLGLLIRRHGHLPECEDAVQEALLAAATQWPEQGVPEHPKAWLVTVADRRLVDLVRADAARRRREDAVALATPPATLVAPGADEPPADTDDTVTLLFLCCHPALSAPSRIALTLRAVGGLTTAEIAHAFLVPEATMAQRISRAKRQIADAGARFEPPPPAERAERLRGVCQVLYLVFNEGYTAMSGAELGRAGLAGEAIRLTRLLHASLPADGEVAGLLALMLLTEARRAARTRPDGSLVPLAEQDRGRWDAGRIAEGVALVTAALAGPALGPYQLQAAIAAVHDEAATDADTDWPQILGLYDLLAARFPSPVVTLNRAVALARVRGPEAGLAVLDGLAHEPGLARQHRLHATRAHLLEEAGRPAEALEAYRAAVRFATNAPERWHLQARAAALNARR